MESEAVIGTHWSLAFFSAWASIGGLAIAIGGFIWTVRVAIQARNAAEGAEKSADSAKAAADAARASVFRDDSIGDLRVASAAIGEGLRLFKNRNYMMVADRLQTARSAVIRVRGVLPGFTDAQRERCQTVVAQLRIIEAMLRDWDHRGYEMDAAESKRLHSVLVRLHDSVEDVSAEMRNNDYLVSAEA